VRRPPIGEFEGGVRRKVMLSYLFFVASLVSNSGFVNPNVNVNQEPMGSNVGMAGETTGGLVVKMGPVMNMRVADVKVYPVHSELPAIARKGSMFEGFSKSRLYAVRYSK
jgi:hypothetical protein